MIGLFITWLYSDAPKALTRYGKEVALALYNYFSIPLLTATLVQPWRHDAVDITRVPVRLWLQVVVNNVTSRMIGFIVRFGVILAGSFCLFVVTLGFMMALLVLYFLPILCVFSMVKGVSLIVGGGV